MIIPTRGESAWLHETIASIENLNRRVVIVVTCPVRVRETLLSSWPALRVIADEGRGLYGVLNAAIRRFRDAEVVTWLNDDDIFLMPGALDALLEFEGMSDCDVVYGRVRMMDAKGDPLGEIPVARCCQDIRALLARGIVPLAQPGTWFRMRLFERLGGLDESFRLAGDLDFFSRALAIGAKFKFVPKVVAGFRLHSGQLSKDEAIGGEEKARALRPWVGATGSAGALLRFRRDNIGVYLDRIRRHGFVSMRRLYRQG